DVREDLARFDRRISDHVRRVSRNVSSRNRRRVSGFGAGRSGAHRVDRRDVEGRVVHSDLWAGRAGGGGAGDVHEIREGARAVAPDDREPFFLRYPTNPPASRIFAAIPDGIAPASASPLVRSSTRTPRPNAVTTIASPSAIFDVSHSIGINPLFTALR